MQHLHIYAVYNEHIFEICSTHQFHIVWLIRQIIDSLNRPQQAKQLNNECAHKTISAIVQRFI